MFNVVSNWFGISSQRIGSHIFIEKMTFEWVGGLKGE